MDCLNCGAPGPIRTADLLVRSQSRTYFHRLSTGHKHLSRLGIVASFQTLPRRWISWPSNDEQRFYGGGGHKNGHSLVFGAGLSIEPLFDNCTGMRAGFNCYIERVYGPGTKRAA